MFTFAIIPLLLLIGAAVDFGQATRVRSQLQNATDVAALSVARDGISATDSQLPGIATKYLNANWRLPYTYKMDKLTFDRPTVTAEVNTTVKVPTTFLQLMGMKTIPVHAHSITKGLGVEIALVLDTSGSMDESAGSGGKKITALKDSTKALFDVLYGSTTVSQRFTIGIVPFAASVNVGSGYSTASWMDKASSPANADHTEDWSSSNKSSVNRFSLYKGGSRGLLNATWRGCVMTRPAPYDIDDTAPTGGNTLFVPWFAPDEPDSYYYNGKQYPLDGPYSNDYLDDDGGNCATAEKVKTDSDFKKQGRTCKYKGENVVRGVGPNYLCDSQPITPLTNSRAVLDTAVTALNADGNTNIVEGFMWGWRAISNAEPFTQGKAYNAPNNRKVIILMTDGVNNYSGKDNANHSQFFAYGYAYHGNIGSTSSNNDTLTTYLDTKTSKACAAAKAKGIIIYSIAFGSGANQSQTLLKGCASDPNYFFAPQNSSDLKPTFQKIAESINALRIAQ